MKAARALLGWSQEDLAGHASVSIPTVKRLEALEGDLGGREETAKKLLSALESAGIVFTGNGKAELGVLLSRKAKNRSV